MPAAPPFFYEFIMDLDGDGVNDVQQFLDARKNQIGSSVGRNIRSSRMDRIPIPKKKKKQTRKVSAYQKRFGKNLKALKRKHPRTEIGKLMSKAHRQTRREMK